MSKITLTNLVNLQNETTAVNAINANNAALTTALDNTLSRDGTSPNTMGAILDMNSNAIVNLPAPVSTSSPARLLDVVSNPSITVPPVGTSGATVPLLNGNNTFSGTNTFTGTTTIPFVQTGTGATSRSLTTKVGETWYSVKDFGAVGDGVTNDTTAIQNTINQAQSVGGIVFLPIGTYKINSALSITSRVTIRGSGFQGDHGLTCLTGGSYLQSTGFLGSTIVVNSTTASAFTIATNYAVVFDNFEIMYPVAAVSGNCITFTSAGGGSNYNTLSQFRNVVISNAYNALSLSNIFQFTIDSCTFLNSINTCISLSVSNSPNFGDSCITNCTFWGLNTTQHIYLSSYGGLRVENNKFNSVGASVVGISIAPDLTGNYIEPLLIVGNSFEGLQTGIAMAQQGGSTTIVSQMVISNNQFFVGTYGINCQGTSGWVNGFTLASNYFNIDSTTGTCLNLDGFQNGVITGNVFSNALANGTGIALGTHSSTVNIQSNMYTSGLATTINDTGTGNTLGGGTH